MELKSLLVDSKTTWVEFPGLNGFEVELANLSRKELTNLRKKCTINKFNRKTRQFEDELNDEKFVIEFTRATVKNWKGLKLEFLQDLLLVDLKDQDPSAQMEHSQEVPAVVHARQRPSSTVVASQLEHPSPKFGPDAAH